MSNKNNNDKEHAIRKILQLTKKIVKLIFLLIESNFRNVPPHFVQSVRMFHFGIRKYVGNIPFWCYICNLFVWSHNIVLFGILKI
jgi:hypothetical protein